MKSAYEIAMERLEKDAGPGKKLSDEQKAAVAEIDKKYEARIAEQKLTFENRTRSAGPGEAASVKAELAQEIHDLEEKREREKEKIWEQAD